MKKIVLWLLTAVNVLIAGALFAVERSDGNAGAVLTPFKHTVKANALIVRTRLTDGKNYLGPIAAKLTDGDFVLEQALKPVDWMFNRPETDFELILGSERELSPQTRLELTLTPAPDGTPEVYAIQPVVFQAHDLSQGIDFETPDRNGVWLAHSSALLTPDARRGLSGKNCLKADWPDGNSMVSLLPGERDWRSYAMLRFTLANPLPGIEGRRSRIMFLYDGKTVQRPHRDDSISTGGLEVLEEGVKTFELDLKLFAKNNPDFDLGNVKSFQIFWSPVVCGPTTFYIDDVKLLTQEELDEEIQTRYGNRIATLKQSCNPGNEELTQLVSELEKRFADGERGTLDGLLEKARELEVIQKLNVSGAFRLLSADAADKVMRDEMPSESSFPVRISAAGNERESFQLVVAPAHALKQCTVSASPLTDDDGASIPASAVAVNPVGYIEVRANAFNYKDARTGMWPDVLLDNQALDLPVRLQPYMITVAVPSGQKPGIYHGTLTVAAQNAKPQTVPYELKVYGFSLPVRGELKTWFGNAYLPSDQKLRRQVYDRFFDYRLNPTGMYCYINKTTYPNIRAFTFLPPLEDIPYCLERGMNFLSLGMLIDRPARDPYTFDDAYIQTVVDWVNRYKPELQKMGAWEMACVNGFDEIMHRGGEQTRYRLAEARKLCTALKKAIPDLKIANIGQLMDIDNSIMDYWFIVPDSHKVFAEKQSKGGMVGFYWAYQDPSFMLDQPGIAPRLCPWLAYKEGATGIGYYSTFRPHASAVPATRNPAHGMEGMTHCTDECSPPNPPQGVDWKRDVYDIEGTHTTGRNGDGILFHPAPGGRLLGSQRLVNLRDGIEDYEYFKLLEKVPGDYRKLLTIGDDVITLRQGDYTTDIGKLKRQRDAVAVAIETAARE